MSWAKRFLPTPSARRATTWATLTVFNRSIFLPTPSARRATEAVGDLLRTLLISTHALREEGDEIGPYSAYALAVFLPTPSARRATNGHCFTSLFHVISTHALREEGDQAIRYCIDQRV